MQRWRRWVGFWQSWDWHFFGVLLRLCIICALIIVFMQYSTPPPGNLYVGVGIHARGSLFNYVGWEADALAGKLFERLLGVYPYVDEAARSDVVRVYMTDLRHMFEIVGQIDRLYTDPEVDDPDTASADLRAERDTLRADLADRQGMVEGILEEQISAVLVEESFGWLGQVLPPVALHFSPLPDVMIISPRDEIRVEASVTLDALPVDRQAALEHDVEDDYDVSALVVPIGGMALYPSMIYETSDLAWSVETAVHEWVHHYLFFFPLGLSYFDGSRPETRNINETVADLTGKELGAMVLRRYYPELAPPPTPEPTPGPTPTPAPTPTPDPNAFDYPAEMHETRVTVDQMLAEGQIDVAEAYMEARRALFYEHGYTFRRINQAFFAFYGGYQAEPGDSAFAGEDPIGPAVRTLRAQSASVGEFLAVVRNITTTEALLAAIE